MSEVSVTFSDTGHAGDRRKRSQLCALNNFELVRYMDHDSQMTLPN